MRCSTVTPGKLATFWRRPVKRLKRVDLPEFGGPISTTVLSCPERGEDLGGTKAGVSQQALIGRPRLADFGCGGSHTNGSGGLAAEGNLHAVHAVDGGVAGRRAAQDRDQRIGNKAHVHQMVLHGFRQVKAHQNPALAYIQFAQHAQPLDSDGPLKRRNS
jgi:hypothetical protein